MSSAIIDNVTRPLDSATAPAVIHSLQNTQLKKLARLRGRRERLHEGQFLIEGLREVTRALQGPVKLEMLYLCPALLPANAQLPWHLPITELSRAAFEKVSGREGPDGVLALASWQAVGLGKPPARCCVLILDQLEKPGNVGALLRSADGAGAYATVLVGEGLDLGNPNLIRASQGSVFTHPVVAWDAEDTLGWLRQHHFTLLACTPEAPKLYWDAPLSGRAALLLGTEHAGLSDFWKAQADQHISIPMRGGADSLNVGMAGTLVMYEALRQQRQHLAGDQA